VGVAPDLILGKEVFILFELFLVAFEVLDHEVLAGELVVVGEVVDHLVVSQSNPCLSPPVPDFGLNRFRTVQTVAQ
jgi:hypothetical protein